MARIGLKTRLAKLEKHRRKQSQNRVLRYNPSKRAEGPTSLDLPVWRAGHWRTDENPASGPLCAFAGRFMLAPDFGTTGEWEAAARKQQRELLALGRSRDSEAFHVGPVSVGNKADAFNDAAPIQPGTRRGRFIELNDGRTFDRETGEFLDRQTEATPGGLKPIHIR